MVSGENTITVHGTPATLLGRPLKVGDSVPDFRVVDMDFNSIHFSSFRGKVCIISAVPSLDTSVCAAQTQRFNRESKTLPEDIQIMVISNDLPFAQKRFCDVKSIREIPVFSDSVWGEFGASFGVFIKDMGLLARATFVVDRDGIITYKEIVPELSHEINYDAAMAAAREALTEKAGKK